MRFADSFKGSRNGVDLRQFRVGTLLVVPVINCAADDLLSRADEECLIPNEDEDMEAPQNIDEQIFFHLLEGQLV